MQLIIFVIFLLPTQHSLQRGHYVFSLSVRMSVKCEHQLT